MINAHANGEELVRMRWQLTAVAVLTLVLTAGPMAVAAGPGWMLADGDLTEWGLDPASGSPWAPPDLNPYGSFLPENIALAYGFGDDKTTSDWSSGGEFYDIEALAVALSTSGGNQFVSWCLITSYGGVDVPTTANPQPAGDPIAYRNGYGVDFPYRRHPVLALNFGTSTATGRDAYDFGVIMAPGHDWQWNENSTTDWNFTSSVGFADSDLGDYDLDFSASDNGTEETISDTPSLWDVTSWRAGHPQEFGDDLPGVPVDFDVRSTSGNTLVAGIESSVWGGPLYLEDANKNGGSGQMYSPWYQRQNWVWEGYASIPTSVLDFAETDAIVDGTWTTTYAMWCTNNHSSGDSLTGAGPSDPVPEPGTWVLLLATGAFGSWLKRRREA